MGASTHAIKTYHKKALQLLLDTLEYESRVFSLIIEVGLLAVVQNTVTELYDLHPQKLKIQFSAINNSFLILFLRVDIFGKEYS